MRAERKRICAVACLGLTGPVSARPARSLTMYASEQPPSAIRGNCHRWQTCCDDVSARNWHGNTGLANRSPTVKRHVANRFTSKLLLSGAAMACGAVACAGNMVGMAPTSSGRQIMLYVSQPLWSAGVSSFRVYGLRIEEVRALPASSQSTVGGSLRRHELVDLQIVPHSDIRIEFGKRLIWNFTHEAFGPQSSVSIGLPIMGISVPDSPRPRPWDLQVSGLSLMAGRLVPDSHAEGVSVTVAAAVITLQWTPSAGRPVTAVNGLATLLPLSRVCSLWTCPVSAAGFHSSSFDH